MVKVKCPACTKKTRRGCPICSGSGQVRRWYVAFTADPEAAESPGAVPLGVYLETVSAAGRYGELERSRCVAVVDRQKLSDAIDVIVAAFGGIENPPLVHKARHSPIEW